MSAAGGTLPAAFGHRLKSRNTSRHRAGILRSRVIAQLLHGGDESARAGVGAAAAAALSRRAYLATAAGSLAGLALSGATRAAILEADDDVELLEKVRQDRKKRLERQGVINSSARETGESVPPPPLPPTQGNVPQLERK